MNPREYGELFSAVAGTDEKTTEAFTRLLATGHAGGGWNSLTQDDFLQFENAVNDSWGRPRRKRKNDLVWKIGRWWHRHITSPIIYPIIEAPFTLARKTAWHAWKKRHGGEVMAPDWRDDGECYIKFIPWTEANAQRRELVAALPLHLRLASRFGRLHTGWDWCCPACDIDFGAPDDTARTEVVATEGLDAHVAEDHGGAMPGECGVTQLFWTRRSH